METYQDAALAKEAGSTGTVPERDSPLRQGAGTSLDWFLVATEASGGGTPDLLCVLEVLGYMELYRQKKHVKGATRAP